MDQQQETLLLLSSQSPTNQLSPLNPIKPPHDSPPPPPSSNPKTGTTVCTNDTPHHHHDSNYPPAPLRFAIILTLLLLSAWANYEASKGFDLTILDTSARTLAGRRFNLLFMSNGRAAGMALKSSSFIERVLYPPGEAFTRKPVHHVTICLSDRNITDDVVVSQRRDVYREPAPSGDQYLIEICLSVMAQKDVMKTAVALALHRGMAYVWLWDGHGSVPQPILDALVGYLSVQYNLPPRRHHKSTHQTSTIASLIQLCEERSNSYFVARLNKAMREKWDEYTVTDAFSSPSDIMCLSHIISASADDDRVLPDDDAGSKLELNQAM